jgi:signal transduction histidine kinase/ActR/RegA family two-component response regulator
MGWVFHLPRLTDWNAGGISMFVNTAICASLGGAATLLLTDGISPPRIWAARIAALIVMLLAGLTAVEHISGVNLGIDTFLIDGTWGQRAATSPMRMGPPACASFLILGMSLLLVSRGPRSRLIASHLAIIPLLIALLSVTGYWFGANQLFGVAHYTGIAFQTSTMVAALGIAAVALVPEFGMAATLRRDDAGGTVFRRLLLPIIVIPLLLGWARIVGQNMGLYDVAFGTALRSLIEVILFFGLLWATSISISRHATALKRSEQELRILAEERSRLLEAERAARSEAERASTIKDEFLATLSHELRTPLNAILGWSQLLSSNSVSGDDFRQGTEAIERNARLQTQLIDDLLDMSRIVSGKIRLDLQRVDLASIVEAAVDSVRPSAEAKHIQMRKAIDPLAGQVSGDPTRLQQVFWNLLTNAIKFTPKDGKVDVLLERVNSHVEVSVHDTGIGISLEFLPVIFERFRQADASTTRSHGGLGLGLSIVKTLVEMHGGSVQAKSAGQGRGTSFIVRLPFVAIRSDHSRERPTTPKSFAIDCEKIHLQGVNVLVVDDDTDARDLITRVLQECHAEVTTASSAKEALDLVAAVRPDVIVSDIGMPECDGYEFIRDVRRLSAQEGGGTPAVALTAFARSEDRTRALMAGYQVHLAKPIEPQELLVTVSSVIGRTGKAS